MTGCIWPAGHGLPTFGLGNLKFQKKKTNKQNDLSLSNSQSRLDGRPEFEVTDAEVQKNCLVFML